MYVGRWEGTLYCCVPVFARGRFPRARERLRPLCRGVPRRDGS